MSSDALETRNLLDKSVQIKKENSANYLRYVIAFALVILCGILASIVNVPNRISISTSSQLSSNDKVYYATLSSDEKLAVFEDFKIKFGKDVRKKKKQNPILLHFICPLLYCSLCNSSIPKLVMKLKGIRTYLHWTRDTGLQ